MITDAERDSHPTIRSVRDSIDFKQTLHFLVSGGVLLKIASSISRPQLFNWNFPNYAICKWI